MLLDIFWFNQLARVRVCILWTSRSQEQLYNTLTRYYSSWSQSEVAGLHVVVFWSDYRNDQFSEFLQRLRSFICYSDGRILRAWYYTFCMERILNGGSVTRRVKYSLSKQHHHHWHALMFLCSLISSLSYLVKWNHATVL